MELHVREVPAIKRHLQKLLQENYRSLKEFKAEFKEELDEDLVEFERFHTTLHLNVLSELSVPELRRLHDSLCIKKAASKHEFFTELWGERKHDY